MLPLNGPDLCHCLAARRSARHLTRLYDRHLAPVGLSTSQFSLLALVEAHPAIAIQDLSVLMVMERTTLMRALKPLREQDLLACEAQGSKAALRLTLSEAGSRKLRQAEPYWLAAQREFEAQAGEQSAADLRQDLLRVVFPV